MKEAGLEKSLSKPLLWNFEIRTCDFPVQLGLKSELWWTKRPALLTWTRYFTGTECLLARTKKWAVVKKRSPSLRYYLLWLFPQGQCTDAMVESPKTVFQVSSWCMSLVWCMMHGADFEGIKVMRNSWGLALWKARRGHHWWQVQLQLQWIPHEWQHHGNQIQANVIRPYTMIRLLVSWKFRIVSIWYLTEAKKHTLEKKKITPSISGVWKTGWPHAEDWN